MADNQNCANDAEKTLAFHNALRGGDPDEPIRLTDLLVNLMHWCNINNESFDEHLDRAQGHHANELESEKG